MKRLFFFVFTLLAVKIYSQQPYCADSSIRIKYIFSDKGANFYNNQPDTTGTNFFTGAYRNSSNTQLGAAILKTTWGDSIIWAKKYYTANNEIRFTNSIVAPNGMRFCFGSLNPGTGAIVHSLICRIDNNGSLIWAKIYKSTLNLTGTFAAGNKNILVDSNAIYLFGSENINNYNIIFKIDFDGNVLWSTGLNVVSPLYAQPVEQAPVLINNSIYIASSYSNNLTNETSAVFTKLNDDDGSFIESIIYKPALHPFIKGITLQTIRKTANNNQLSLSGFTVNNIGTTYSILFSAFIDTAFNPINITTNRFSIFANPGEFQYDFNTANQFTILAREVINISNKYFITFNSNNSILRSRKFSLTGNFNTTYSNSVNLDNKQNLHFLYHYPTSTTNSPIVTEYARISNFSPNGTLGCFGKDTSFITPYPDFTLTKQPHIWNNIISNAVISSPITLTEDSANVSKQVVCKIVSYCDTVKISGPAAVCVGVPVRYTIRRNNTCLKYTEWSVDTAFATIVNLEGDSAININFKKAFNGRIYAALTDCVVKDSFLVKAVVPKMLPLLKRTDSLLCPGKTLVLAANNGYSNYVWQGNAAGQQFTVNAVGVYTVTALDSCGITKTDSIRVILSDTALTIPPTQTICLYDTAFITLPNDVNNISWQPTTNALLNNKTLLFYPPQTTLYTITAERLPACGILKTTTIVIKICPQTVFIPNAFTPQKNGLNDIFKPTISQPLPFYRLQIFNRYGQTIFESSNQQSGWDGTYKGKQQPMGGYIYQCSYRFAGKAEKMVKGYFILVR